MKKKVLITVSICILLALGFYMFTPGGTSNYTEVNGVKIYYKTYGSGQPLIFLHGGLYTGEINWAGQVSAFSNKYLVIVPDSRGHGKTKNPAGKYSYKLMAEDIVLLVKKLGLKKPIICGYSDGAITTMTIGIHYPDFAKALIICGGTDLLAASDRYKKGMKKVFGATNYPKLNLENFKKLRKEDLVYLRYMHGKNWEKLLVDIWPMWTTPLNYTKENFANIKIPVLIVVGDNDEFISLQETMDLHKKLPISELATFPGTDHSLMIYKSQIFNPILSDFLERLEKKK